MCTSRQMPQSFCSWVGHWGGVKSGRRKMLIWRRSRRRQDPVCGPAPGSLFLRQSSLNQPIKSNTYISNIGTTQSRRPCPYLHARGWIEIYFKNKFYCKLCKFQFKIYSNFNNYFQIYYNFLICLSDRIWFGQPSHATRINCPSGGWRPSAISEAS